MKSYNHGAKNVADACGVTEEDIEGCQESLSEFGPKFEKLTKLSERVELVEKLIQVAPPRIAAIVLTQLTRAIALSAQLSSMLSGLTEKGGPSIEGFKEFLEKKLKGEDDSGPPEGTILN